MRTSRVTIKFPGATTPSLDTKTVSVTGNINRYSIVRMFSGEELAKYNLESLRSENAILLETYGIDPDDIPAEFCCLISGEIMDRPMADPTTLKNGHSNMPFVPKYDEKFLSQYLSIHDQISPTTRDEVLDPLVLDERLLDEIDDYMSRCRAQKTNVPCRTSVTSV